jgi:hypothetical protein
LLDLVLHEGIPPSRLLCEQCSNDGTRMIHVYWKGLGMMLE